MDNSEDVKTNEEVTKEIEKIEDIEVIEDEKENLEEIQEEREEVVDLKKKKKKKIIIILIVLILLVLITWFLLSWMENKNKEKIKEEVYKEEKLTDKEIEKKINSYGKAMEKIISATYTKENRILTYEEVIKSIHNSEDISCDVHEIYEDGKIYLNECSYAGKKTKYSYGEKQVVKQIDETTTIVVYVNKSNKKATLDKPNNTTNYDVYTVDTGSKYSDVDLFGDSEYVLYLDLNNAVHMKNYITGKDVITGMNVNNIRVFTDNGKYDTTYVALLINSTWAIYNLNTSKMVVANIYSDISSISSTGTSPVFSIEVKNSSYVKVVGTNGIGVINYKTGKDLVPVVYDSITLGNNYLLGKNNYTSRIYDFNGKTYLDDMFDKIYDITTGDYVIALKDNRILLTNISGKVISDFGDDTGIIDYFYSFEWDGKLLVQFVKEDTVSGECIEYSYDLEKKTLEVNDTACAGID